MGSGGIDTPFVTSALGEDEWSVYRSTERSPCTHSVGGWMGPTAGLNAVEREKSVAPSEKQTLKVQTLACPCTDSAIPAPIHAHV
jgi:hypothetical protein